jgi:hypothetical protein
VKQGRVAKNLNRQIFEYLHDTYLKPTVDLSSINEILTIIGAICLSCQNMDNLLLFIKISADSLGPSITQLINTLAAESQGFNAMNLKDQNIIAII